MKSAPALGFLVALAAATAHAAPPVVVLDPGHGGSNPGTSGAGLHEKQLTLTIDPNIPDNNPDQLGSDPDIISPPPVTYSPIN